MQGLSVLRTLTQCLPYLFHGAIDSGDCDVAELGDEYREVGRMDPQARFY